MLMLTVSISFDSSKHAWVVCRARTVVQTHASFYDAVRGACKIAVALRRRMHCHTQLRVWDENDGWHVHALWDDSHSLRRRDFVPAAKTLMRNTWWYRRRAVPKIPWRG